MEREAKRPQKTDAEIEAELERLSAEAQATLEAERKAVEARSADFKKEQREARAEMAKAMGKTSLDEEDEDEPLSIGGKIGLGVLALFAVLLLWGLVIQPLLGVALVLGVVALIGFGVVKVIELSRGKPEEPGDSGS